MFAEHVRINGMRVPFKPPVPIPVVSIYYLFSLTICIGYFMVLRVVLISPGKTREMSILPFPKPLNNLFIPGCISLYCPSTPDRIILNGLPFKALYIILINIAKFGKADDIYNITRTHRISWNR